MDICHWIWRHYAVCSTLNNPGGNPKQCIIDLSKHDYELLLPKCEDTCRLHTCSRNLSVPCELYLPSHHVTHTLWPLDVATLYECTDLFDWSRSGSPARQQYSTLYNVWEAGKVVASYRYTHTHLCMYSYRFYLSRVCSCDLKCACMLYVLTQYTPVL